MGANLERIVEAARWKMGALRGDFGFQLGNLGYDSDIYFGSLRDRVPDYMFSVIPSVHIFLPLKKRFVLDIAETPQYVFFLKTKEERAWNHSFEGRTHFVMDRLYFMAGAGLINARERLNTEVNLYVRRKESNLQGLAFWQISEGTAISVLFRFADHGYENPPDSGIDIRQNFNRTERHLNVTAYLLQISRMRVFLDADYGSYTLGEAQARDRSLRSYGIFGGIEFVPPPEGGGAAHGLQGRVNLGYVRFDLQDPRFKDFEGLVGNTGISLNLSRYTTLRAQLSRNFQFSVYSELGYYFQTGFGGGISQALSRRMTLTYDLALSRNDYLRLEGGGPSNVDPIKYDMHTLGLGLRLRESLGLQLTTSLSLRKSERVEPAFRRYIIAFSLIYGSSSGNPGMSASPLSR